MAIGDYALGRFAAGPYSGIANFNGLTGLNPLTAYSLGLTQDGFMIGWASMAELLNKTDRYGNALIESFHQGCRMSINCVFHEWKDTEVAMITPNSVVDPTATSYWSNGIVGSLGTDFSMSLALTARPNTPASVNGVASITFPLLKCRSDYDIGMLFGPEHRVIPFMADAFLYTYPSAAGGVAYAVSG
jgi:hypothetical protein